MSGVAPTPVPVDLGLPSRFTAFRSGQLRTAEALAASAKRFLLLSAPTGSGKSLIYTAVSALRGARTLVLVGTKGLQEQLCVAPETRVLFSDLVWRAVAEAKEGDVLLGFDEHRTPNRRMWRPATVEHTATIKKPCSRLVFADGVEIICSTDHRWLVDYQGAARWLATDRLRCEKTLCSRVLKPLEVWSTLDDRTGGYLAGVLDGEGCLGQYNAARGRGYGVSLSFAQCYNELLFEALRLLDGQGIRYSITSYRRKSAKHQDCAVVKISGRADILRLLGMVRPHRLLPKLDLGRLGMVNPAKRVDLVAKESAGTRWVVAPRTSTGTFLAEGFASHNCTDFGAMGMVDVRGRGNYSCPDWDTCDQPYQLDTTCEHAQEDGSGCPYRAAVERAAGAHLVVSNYAYWMSLAKYSDAGALRMFDLLVLDEAHGAPEWLSSFATVTFHRSEVRALLDLDLPEPSQPIEVWAQWARGAGDVAADALLAVDKSDARTRLKLTALVDGLAEVAVADADARGVVWVVEGTHSGVKVCPVWAHPFAERYLFQGVEKVLLCSATLSPSVGRYLGIDPAASEYFEVGSSFDPARQPFIYIPTVRVDRNMTEGDLRVWVNAIDRIIEGRLDRKGVIHARSYARAQEIVRRSRFASLMLTHDSGKSGAAVEKFKTAHAPMVLVSPAIEEGVDLPYDQCRYQIAAKVPFADGRSPVTKARAASDKRYLNYLAAQSIVQLAGRGMRAVDDRCEVFLTDDHWVWFSQAGEFPKWFKATWRRSTVVPPAPALGMETAHLVGPRSTSGASGAR